MQQNLTWLTTSIYCSRTTWHKVLEEGIKPFLLKNKYCSYRLEFNYLSGENIRFSLQVPSESAEIIAKKADLYFKNYFLNSKLPNTIIKMPLDGLFLPFPTNTIQYGLYKILNHKEDFSYNFIAKYISDLMLELLIEDEVNEETIITFALYLHVGFLRVGLLKNKEIILQFYIEQSKFSNADLDENLLNIKVEDNKQILRALYQEIICKDRIEVYRDSPWLEHWIRLLEDSIRDSSFAFSLDKITNLIDRHLGVNDNMKRLLYDFIIKMLLQ